jgi:hypothetical protein
MAWSLLMALWLPMIDSAKSYQEVMLNLQNALPVKHTCINSIGFGEPQRALLNYYTNLNVLPIRKSSELGCDLYLIQEDKTHEQINPGQDWKLIWKGKRAADRYEKFRLYQKVG